ncbi:hypothetical protein [Fuerstiella marisgermanici]|uniref:Uncharacterized protein n=1 Tax=Fuerstiella marisgermanici TaxID=1891926 RepID=A0A1P8WLJ6_9PLAN|nr:hypothetical protein [Fuerstiella marisgermanici]APZ94925.1 hypothetical protein Fuma_04576 [Fuerstiella marisgermanici]
MPAIKPPTQSATRVMSTREWHQSGRSSHRRTARLAVATLLLAISVVTCLFSVPRPASAQTANAEAEATLSAADQKATELARAAHKQAAAINGLPRFYYRVNEWHGMVERMRARPQPTIKILALALRGTVKAPAEGDSSNVEESSVGAVGGGVGYDGAKSSLRHRVEGKYTFGWDENYFLFQGEFGRQPARGKMAQFWTHEDSWWREEYEGRLHNISRGPSAFAFWQDVRFVLFSCYLRQTPRAFWWGRAVHSEQTISTFPPAEATWTMMAAETFAGEPCYVVESAQRRERLWISKATGRVRGILSYYYKQLPDTPHFFESENVAKIAGRNFESSNEYGRWSRREATPEQVAELRDAWDRFIVDGFPENAKPNELIRLADYREVKSGVWIPFEEERVNTHPSGPDKSNYVKTRIVVEAVEFDRSLEEAISKLKPKDGDPIQDRRFGGVTVSYRHGQLTDAEVKAKAEASKAKGAFRGGVF